LLTPLRGSNLTVSDLAKLLASKAPGRAPARRSGKARGDRATTTPETAQRLPEATPETQ